MYRMIVLYQGKKMLVYSLKNVVIKHFLNAIKSYENIGMKVNKNTWTFKFNTGTYNYTFIVPKTFVKQYLNNEL